MPVKIAFLKDDNTFYGKIVKFFTNSNYSHVELVIDEYGYSSDFNIGVYCWEHKFDKNKWDYINIDVDIKNILEFYDMTRHDRYDWFSVINTIIPIRTSPDKWQCAEWTGTALKISGCKKLWKEDMHSLTPQKLYNILLNK